MEDGSFVTVSNSGIGNRSPYSSVHRTKPRSEKDRTMSLRSDYDREELNLKVEKNLKLPTKLTEEYLSGYYMSTRTNKEMKEIILN